jgi:hypothetical protein
MDWNWEAVAGFVGAGILVLAGAIAWWQVREMRRGRNADLVVQLFQQYRTTEAKQELEKVYKQPPEILEEWHKKDQAVEIENILDRLEMLGILISQNVFDEELAIRLFGGMPVRSWYCLRSYIENRRKEQGHYARYVQEFAKRSIKYQIEHYPENEWTRLKKDSTPETNLVQELQKDTSLLPPHEKWIAHGKRWVGGLFDERLRT